MNLPLKITLITLFCLIPSLSKADINIVDVKLRITYDRLSLPGNEKMGLLGSSFLIDKKLNPTFSLYSGLSVYSAVTGMRGGFFTGGISAGLKTRLEHWILDTGYFVGGGGGGEAPQGGGLMLRPHLAIIHDFQTFRMGFFVSKTSFPNGNINSKQIGFQVERHFQWVFASAPKIKFKHLDLFFRKVTIAPSLQFYAPGPEVKNRRKIQQDKMALIGIEAGVELAEQFFFYAEAAGTFKGKADGFAELLGGIIYAHPLNPRISLRFKGAMGSAGGGRVDTGGGIIYKVTGGLSLELSKRLRLNMDYGVVDAPRGNFRAQMFKPALAYQMDTAFPFSQRNRQKHPEEKGLDQKKIKLENWTIRTSLSRYFPDKHARKYLQSDEGVDLFQIKLDRALSARIYFTGQASGAFDGDAGGYATGLFGFGFQHAISKPMSVLIELLAGAGGGGGIASDGGSIIQPMLGLTYQISQHFGIQFLAGRIKALRGDLDTTVVDIGLVLPFSTIETK